MFGKGIHIMQLCKSLKHKFVNKYESIGFYIMLLNSIQFIDVNKIAFETFFNDVSSVDKVSWDYQFAWLCKDE